MIRAIGPDDRPRLADFLRSDWGSTRMVSNGRLHDTTELPGFVAVERQDWLGYSQYEVVGPEMEVVTLESLIRERGAGTALIAACTALAISRGLGRLWLVTTNDNLRALSFYQRRGFVLVALRPGAVDEARRKLKPEIRLTGQDDIPIRDELELELPRDQWPSFVERYSWPPS